MLSNSQQERAYTIDVLVNYVFFTPNKQTNKQSIKTEKQARPTTQAYPIGWDAREGDEDQGRHDRRRGESFYSCKNICLCLPTQPYQHNLTNPTLPTQPYQPNPTNPTLPTQPCQPNPTNPTLPTQPYQPNPTNPTHTNPTLPTQPCQPDPTDT